MKLHFLGRYNIIVLVHAHYYRTYIILYWASPNVLFPFMSLWSKICIRVFDHYYYVIRYGYIMCEISRILHGLQYYIRAKSSVRKISRNTINYAIILHKDSIYTYTISIVVLYCYFSYYYWRSEVRLYLIQYVEYRNSM